MQQKAVLLFVRNTRTWWLVGFPLVKQVGRPTSSAMRKGSARQKTHMHTQVALNRTTAAAYV